MGIRYLCFDCRRELREGGSHVVNEVGRKYCDRCGSNDNDLECLNQKDFDEAVERSHKGGLCP